MAKRYNIDLDSLSTEELNELLDEVMFKLRNRDAQELKKSLSTKSQRITLPEHIDRHLAKH